MSTRDKLDKLYQTFFLDQNTFMLLTEDQGWKEAEIISVDITRTITIRVKPLCTEQDITLNGIDEITRRLTFYAKKKSRG